MRTQLVAPAVVALLAACDPETTSGANPDVAELQATVSDLETQVAALAQTVATLQASTSVDALDGRLAAAEAAIGDHELRLVGMEEADVSVAADLDELTSRTQGLETAGYVPAVDLGELLALVPYVEVDPSTDDVRFVGANVHVRNGTGTGAQVNGLGNLIIGYNATDGTDDRGGSHNLVIGDQNTYSSYHGLVASRNGAISAEHAIVLGGADQTASGPYSTIVGGGSNQASGVGATVCGGSWHVAAGPNSLAAGGFGGAPQYLWSTTVGGAYNQATGDLSSAVGGFGAATNGYGATTVGGYYLLAEGDFSFASP